ncbi:hypothetical protein TELCIR_17340, partial [Teladorsagia circumcincta]
MCKNLGTNIEIQSSQKKTAFCAVMLCCRTILRTSSADEFYTLMGKLCKELAEMNQEEQDHLITVIYTMAEFPYPGLAELREKHKWNIQPLTPAFKLVRKSADDILKDGNIRRKLNNWNNLRSLRKQYRQTKQRQKQAASPSSEKKPDVYSWQRDVEHGATGVPPG